MSENKRLIIKYDLFVKKGVVFVMEDLVFAYEVTYSYGQCAWVDFVVGKFKTLKNGSKQFITLSGRTISIKSLKSKLTEKERKKYAELIKDTRIADCIFESEKDKSLKEESEKWIADIINKSDEDVIAEEEKSVREYALEWVRCNEF